MPPQTYPTASCFTPCPRGPSEQMRWHTAGLGGLRKYAFPPVSLLAQTLCKVREDEEQVLLVSTYWPNRTWFPELMLLATAPPFSERGHPLAPGGSRWATSSGSKHSSTNPSTRHAYRLKWNLFIDWCSPRWEDPRRCLIAVVLSILQDGLE